MSHTTSGIESVSFYMERALRIRAREAFRRTGAAEDNPTWSSFVAAAVLAEVERREALYNGGGPFCGTEEPLRPGRSKAIVPTQAG